MQKPNLILSILIAVAALSVSGCSSVSSTTSRSLTTGLGSGVAAAAAYKLSDGDATTTALAAVGGAVVTQLAQGEDPAVVQKGFDQGYMQGQSDAIKRQYFLRQAMEQKPEAKEEGEDVVYVIPGPAVSSDGTKLAPHQVSVRVIE